MKNNVAGFESKSRTVQSRPCIDSVPPVIICCPENNVEEQKCNEEDLDSIDEFKAGLDLLESKLYGNGYENEQLLIPHITNVPSVITCRPESTREEQKCNEEDLDSVDEFKAGLDLLESNLFEDNRYGIERLVKLVNSEVVNSKCHGSFAQALLCGNPSNSNEERLRKIFISLFCESRIPYTPSDSMGEDRSFDEYSCSLEEESFLSYETSYCSNPEKPVGRNNGALKLPALRVVASSLELLASLEVAEENKVDLSSPFWTEIFRTISYYLANVRSIEATLSIKCIRLLRKLEPDTIDPYVRYTLFPLVSNAYQFGISRKDRILIREAERLLKPLGLSP